MLSPRDAFKVGFLSRCIEEGLDLNQTHDRVKLAMDKVALEIPGLSTAWDAAKNVAGYGIPLLLAAPPVLGGLAGYGAAKMSDIGDLDVKDIKRRELIDELQRQTQRLQVEKATRDAQKQQKRPGRMFL